MSKNTTKKKVTFFNPTTLRKRSYVFTISWNSMNHEWDVEMYDVAFVNRFGTSTTTIKCDPLVFIQRFVDNLIRDGEYASIK